MILSQVTYAPFYISSQPIVIKHGGQSKPQQRAGPAHQQCMYARHLQQTGRRRPQEDRGGQLQASHEAQHPGEDHL